MQIIVKNPTAFRVAQASTSKQDFQASFRYINIKPDGRMYATNGYYGMRHASAVEPFDSEKDVFVMPTKDVPKGARDIIIDTDAQIITFTTGSRGNPKPGVVACKVETENLVFPDFDRVVPSQAKAWDSDIIGYNVQYLATLDKALGGDGQMYWQTSGTGASPSLIITDDPDLTILIVPLRIMNDGKFNTPLPRA